MQILAPLLLLTALFQTPGITGTLTTPAPNATVTLAPSDHPGAPVTLPIPGTTFHFAPQPPGLYTACIQAPAFLRKCIENIDLRQQSTTTLTPIDLKPQPPTDPAATANTGRVFTPQSPQTPPTPAAPTKDDLLRGSYGPYRANNDLLYYHLDVRVDPVQKTIAGKNTIRFRMLANGTRIQIDLVPDLAVDKITLNGAPLKYTRDERTVFIDFPHTLRKGRTYAIDFFYSGHPVEGGRFGGMVFKTDPAGRPWINTSCEDEGASVWWPNKDQWRDEPESMDISVAIPSNLIDVSNGRFLSKVALHDGYNRWNYHVSYPINNYDVVLNIGAYTHFGAVHNGLTLDYYVLPENLAKAKLQFAQVPSMIDAFEHYFGQYPFERDGYKLVEVPYAGMEHQTAVAYGNEYENGYLHRDWTGVGISPRFDFIIIHESGHEWFGNSITAQDRSDMWIHEGWTTYLECLYVEYMWGHPDEVTYVNALKRKVHNDRPIITHPGLNEEPPQDEYFKGALFLNTLRSIINNDPKWFALIHDFYQTFKYQTIMTEDVVKFFNQRTGMDLKPIFDQYLRHTAIPTLDLKFDPTTHTVAYRWQADEPNFAMPIEAANQTLHPTTTWQTTPTTLTPDQFKVATDRFYINVNKTTINP